jgi:hypothetical protein
MNSLGLGVVERSRWRGRREARTAACVVATCASRARGRLYSFAAVMDTGSTFRPEFSLACRARPASMCDVLRLRRRNLGDDPHRHPGDGFRLCLCGVPCIARTLTGCSYMPPILSTAAPVASSLTIPDVPYHGAHRGEGLGNSTNQTRLDKL